MRAWYERNKEQVAVQARRSKLLRHFNLTPEQYDAMLEAQGGVCAICGRPETRKDRRTDRQQRLSVDHQHSTGTVRGLLCHHCNTAIGKLQDDPALIRKAADYVEARST